MGGIVDWIQSAALASGAAGLFVVAFLDSSFLSLPEIADLLVIWMVTRHKARFLLYVVASTSGSLAGCLVLYYLGRKGGEALARKRFHPATVERTVEKFRRHGVMAVLIPSLLPPPAPFKLFVLLAGVAEISVGRFTVAIGIGRGARYLGEALLAIWYGDQALAFVHAHGRTVSIVLAGLMVAGFAGFILWSRASAAKRR